MTTAMTRSPLVRSPDRVIAGVSGIQGKRIGRIKIEDDHSFIDLPAGMPKEVFLKLQKIPVAGQALQISRPLKAHAKKLQRDDRPPSRKDKFKFKDRKKP